MLSALVVLFFRGIAVHKALLGTMLMVERNLLFFGAIYLVISFMLVLASFVMDNMLRRENLS
ncbi:hypothetical protein [Heyndrickxia acidicola]|uniref:Uncharacterized protein n=1 Tax=Heyndrickxia acidicola TaxID=209389 RepID=A0ABU6MJ20_9BACI|nr:hypothetical protein [Heyndrickxia acidicola]MED1204664.1 hypothetical protein [Heyndrickxia acidicola]